MQIDRNAPVITRLIEARSLGKKTAVFLGRGDSQSLPNENGWEWYSLNNVAYLNTPKISHIVLDFNENSSMKQLTGLFNKVVFDWSTSKFCNKPFQVVYDLLEKDVNSEALVEFYPSRKPELNEEYDPETMSFNKSCDERFSAHKLNLAAFNKWKEKIGPVEFQNRFDAFKLKEARVYPDTWDNNQIEHDLLVDFREEILESENIKTEMSFAHIYELKERVELMIKERFFNNLNYVDGLHPYRTAEEAEKMMYWVLQSPLKSV